MDTDDLLVDSRLVCIKSVRHTGHQLCQCNISHIYINIYLYKLNKMKTILLFHSIYINTYYFKQNVTYITTNK